MSKRTDARRVKEAPRIVVLAGPNGAGKSTSARAILQGPLRVDEFVNADVIAQGLSGFDPEGASIAAGRIMLARLHKLAAQRADFAFETTLASRTFAPWIAELRIPFGLPVASISRGSRSACGKPSAERWTLGTRGHNPETLRVWSQELLQTLSAHGEKMASVR